MRSNKRNQNIALNYVHSPGQQPAKLILSSSTSQGDGRYVLTSSLTEQKIDSELVLSASNLRVNGFVTSYSGYLILSSSDGSWAHVSGNLAVKTPTYPPLDVRRTTTSTNSRQATLRFAVESSAASISDGFGTHIDLGFGDNDTSSVLSRVGTERDSADNSSKMYLQSANAGTLVDRLTIDHTGSAVMSGNFIMDTNKIRFTDVLSGAIHELSADDTTHKDTGVTLRTLTNPGSGDAIFRVLSAGGSERLRVEHNGDTTTTNALGVMRAATTYNLEVAGDAGKTAAGTGWNIISDIGRKKNIQDLVNPDLLLFLRPRIFEWNKPENHGNEAGPVLGFIAQEVEQIFPDWVKIDKNDEKWLQMKGFEALVVKLLQKHDLEIKQLQNQIDTLLSASSN